MIIATNVTKKFGKLLALDNVSLICNRGEAISLMGPNGSGKTTFIKSLLGMVVPDSGFITYNQQNIAHDWQYRNSIGYMPQIGRYPDNMTIGQVFNMMKDIRQKMVVSIDEELVESFELKSMMQKRMNTLSGGTRQKVSAALAFLFNPDVLILDEPTAGLDPLASEILKAKISRERLNGKLILISSHILSDLDDIVSEVIYLQEGRVKFHRSVKELQDHTGEQKLARVVASLMKNKAI